MRKINQTKLSKQQKNILGWLYVAQLHPGSLWGNSPFEPEVGLRPLRQACIPLHRKKGIRLDWRKTWWKVSERKQAAKYLPFLWYVSHAESASFSRSIKRLEERGLIETKKGMIYATWEERSKVVKIIRNRPMRLSAQRDMVQLTGKGQEIVKSLLTRSMKRRITVNKKMRLQ